MALINCPECGNECSSTAVSCPQCGYAFVKPAAAPPRVVVREVEREDSFPKWVFIPLALLGVIVLVVLFVMLRSDDTADQRNINVNVASARQTQTERDSTQTTTVPSTSQPSTVTVPSTSQPPTVTMPQTVDPSQPSTITSVPSTGVPSSVAVPAPPDKASVLMEAKIISKTGKTLPAPRVRFYLLDKDLESILAEANIEDESGQGLLTAFGLSTVNQSRYRETYQKANNAIKKHIVYSTTSDAAGKAQLKDVKPKDYYLFAVTTTRDGFAIWNSPVFITGGENVLNLSPAMLTEVAGSESNQ
jgi:type II secretory pathway pseudopilin PulG